MSSTDHQAKYERRKALRDKVETYWLEEAKRPSGQLDASLKKHTTLLNRLKSSLLVGPADALIKEIDGLTLTKYLEEIAAAIVEGASKGKGDAEVAVDVIAHLHTRLTPDFLPLVIAPMLTALSPGQPSKDGDGKDDKERISRQRVILRIIAELGLINAWPEGIKKGAGEVGKVLQGLMSNDPQYNNLPLPTAFLKYFGRTYLGPQPGTQDKVSDGVEELVPSEIQGKMRQLFTGYFEGASKTLVKGQHRLLEQDRRNHEAYIKSGEIFEDRQQAYEKMTKAVERLTSGVQSLSELLGLPMPSLPTAASLAKSGLQIVQGQSSFTVREDGAVPGGIWDDEEERRFYEEFLNLRQVVPAGLLGVKDDKPLGEGQTIEEAEKNQREEKQKQDEEDIRRQLEQLEVSAETTTDAQSGIESAANPVESPVVGSSALPDDGEYLSAPETEDDGMQSGPAARLNVLFAALPEAVNREMIDKLAVEFASLNSKAARKRLVRFLGAVPKNRTDLLPHYARFVATLNPYMPDIATGLLEILDEELRYLQRKRHVRELDGVRLKNVRFYGELAKFKVAKPYTILHVLKVFLDDFKFNIENIANLLENCGRFLLRYEGTAKTAKDMVELMRRKQGTSHLDQRHNVMLENAFYMCNPPERVAKEVVELSPMQSFIQHLLHDVLAKRTLDKVTKLLRKLHWDDQETYDYLITSFTQVWELRYSNIPFLAAIVYDLQRHHPEFSVIIVDQVMEDIRVGMEDNIFKHNQRRISSVRYLGELYMYRVINAAVIFDTLWSLVSFGHGEGLPVPGRDSPIDSVDDFFRVRLVCTLLDTCGTCFDRGSGKRKLDQFLTVFQLYVLCKSEVPMDVDFMLNDTFDLIRPKTPRLKTFSEAAGAVDTLLADQAQHGEDVVSEEGSDDEHDRGDNDDGEEEEDQPITTRLDDSEVEEDEEEEEEEIIVIRDQKRNMEMDQEAEGDFDREFARMLTDTTDVRRPERKTASIFDTAVPLIKKRGETSNQDDSSGKGMNFTLLSKKGNKQQLRNLDIPLDSAIALNSMSHQQRNKAEQEQLKRLVLQNERRQEKSEMMAIQEDARQRGIKLRFVPS